MLQLGNNPDFAKQPQSRAYPFVGARQAGAVVDAQPGVYIVCATCLTFGLALPSSKGVPERRLIGAGGKIPKKVFVGRGGSAGRSLAGQRHDG